MAIDQSLDAVAILAPEIVAHDFQLTPPSESVGEPSVISEIVAVVTENGGLLLPKHIRRLLRQREGVPAFSDNYFYTALKRAADKHLIARIDDRYGPMKNPGAEAPGP